MGPVPPFGSKICGGSRNGLGSIEGLGARMPKLIELLSDRLGRTVIDKTGFHGTFNFALNFSPEEAAGPRDDFTSPSIFTALQDQLGLQLHSVKGPVTVLVIDHVGRPDEN